MAAFWELDWRRIDVTAIIAYGGLVTIDERRHEVCRAWLLREGYDIDTLDCRAGLAQALPELGELLGWEQQFGYTLGSANRNLDALRDGFTFPVREGGGRVFEVLRPDLVWHEDPQWMRGLLAISQEHCRQQLAVGCRFFALLVVPEHSTFVGALVDEVRVPAVYWNPSCGWDNFEE